MGTKVVTSKPLEAIENSYLPGILTGLWVTLKNMFRKPVTLEYPEQKPPTPVNYRGVPTLVADEQGRTKCVSCQLCEFVCPARAIRITPAEIPADDPNAHIEKIPQKFEINMLRCIYCGLCEEVCPESAIKLKNVYSLNGTSRPELVLGKEQLLELGGREVDPIRKWDKKK
jgi:NADH-quinone oxidoreductase subunit I